MYIRTQRALAVGVSEKLLDDYVELVKKTKIANDVMANKKTE